MSQIKIDSKRPYLIFKILWFAMTASLFLFLYIVTQGNFSNLAFVSIDSKNSTELVLIGMALLNFILSFVFPSWILKTQVEALKEPVAHLSDVKVAENAFTPYVLKLALHESIALFGLVLGILTQEAGKFLPFFLVALLLNVLVFPRGKLFFQEALKKHRF